MRECERCQICKSKGSVRHCCLVHIGNGFAHLSVCELNEDWPLRVVMNRE